MTNPYEVSALVADAREVLADGLHSNGHFVLADHVRRGFNTMIPSIDALAAMERYRAADALPRSPSVRVDAEMVKRALDAMYLPANTPEEQMSAALTAALTKATP